MVTNTLEDIIQPTGVKKIVNKFPRPDQLQKVTQSMHGLLKKYQTTKAMLKTTVLCQLDGVILTMNSCLHVEDENSNTGTASPYIPAIESNLPTVSKEYRNQSQCVTEVENMKRLFAMPESVRKANKWISDGELMFAHQCLIDLENFRDDYLFELHKSPNQSNISKVQVRTCFEDAETVSQVLKNKLKEIIIRILDIATEDPNEGPLILETVFRIIEREENFDAVALKRQRRNGFLPPGRPKKWREMAFNEFEQLLKQRLDRIEIDNRSSDEKWLLKYLEKCRELILNDLRMIDSLCGLKYGPCFPLSYDMINKFVQMYHQLLSSRLEKIISDGLEGDEYVSMLSWIKGTYFSSKLLQHPDLHIDISVIRPLLNSDRIRELQLTYLDIMEKHIEEWLLKTLVIVKQDWHSDVDPDESVICSQNDTPVIIFKMIQDYLDVTKEIGDDLTQAALALGMDQVRYFGETYYEAMIDLKKTHFDNRSRIPYFTHHTITILNNCLKFQELAEDMRKLYLNLNEDESRIHNYNDLHLFFEELRNEAAFYLLEEAFLDLENNFQNLLTAKWLSSSVPIDTICVTLEDYFQDYVLLKERNLEYVKFSFENMVAKRYISAILQKKIKFRILDERQEAAAKIIREVNQLRALFIRVAPGLCVCPNSPLEAIPLLAEVLKTDDLEMITLDLHVLVDRFPDVTDDHLTRLLALREDISKSEIREKISDVRQNRNCSKISSDKSIFDQIS